jgi:cyclopropane fatty-acyl-phospholipid synthase-like methyltransferase
MSDAELFWDEKYDVPHYRYGTDPNAFIAASVETYVRAPSQVLVVGSGEGRNAVWLAQKDFEVTAVEVSGKGIAKTKELMSDANVLLRIIKSDFADWEPEEGRYKAVVMTFVHMPPELREETHAKAIRALDTEGYLFLEAFTPEQLQHDTGGPKDREMLYTEEILQHDFAELQPELLEERTITLDEGPGHAGDAEVIRFIGQK